MSFRAIRRRPLRSKRAMISPVRLRAKASGFTRMSVRSMGTGPPGARGGISGMPAGSAGRRGAALDGRALDRRGRAALAVPGRATLAVPGRATLAVPGRAAALAVAGRAAALAVGGGRLLGHRLAAAARAALARLQR